MDYTGTIIEESLETTEVLNDCTILSSRISVVTEKSNTPWLKQWTLHKVQIPEDQASSVAEKISHAIDREHQNAWYADFENDHSHYIVFRNKVFFASLDDRATLDEAKRYGMHLGIPEYQLTF